MDTWLHIVLWIISAGTLLWLLVALPWFGAIRTSHYSSPFEDKGPFSFPEGFLWGASTAAQQIESQQNSDWTALEKQALREEKFEQLELGVAKPGHIHNLGSVPAEAVEKKTDFDNRFADDLKLMSEHHHNAYRFSISWSRLFPTEDTLSPSKEALQYYHDQLDTLESLGMTPSATLFHFSSPAWLWQEKDGKRGWERDDALQHFERFVRSVAQEYGGRIDHWCTLNEPMVYLYNGYLEGIFPPNEQREGGPVSIAHLAVILLKAHMLGYDILKQDAKQRGKEIEVGIAKHTRSFEAYRNYAPLDRLTAQFAQQAFVWDFLDAIHTGEYRMYATSFVEYIPGLQGKMDYVGINYYGRFYLESNVLTPGDFDVLARDDNDPNEITSDLGWSLYPHGFYKTLKASHDKYMRPIYILENGIDCRDIDDTLRQHFLVAHLREVWNAIEHAGADIKGFFYWSLMDNFEWAEGFGPRFGLLHVDYENDFARTPRKSAALFAEIIEQNALSQDHWNTHKTYDKKGPA